MTNKVQDETSALERYLEAAKNGSASAQYHLGMMYANGFDVEKNAGEAAEWYRKARSRDTATRS